MIWIFFYSGPDVAQVERYLSTHKMFEFDQLTHFSHLDERSIDQNFGEQRPFSFLFYSHKAVIQENRKFTDILTDA